jgi:hypothetical protein
MVGNLAALAAGTATALAREVRWPVVGTALAGLALAVALGKSATVAAGLLGQAATAVLLGQAATAVLLGQAATAVLLVVIVRRATEPSGAAPGRPAGLGAVAAAWNGGMGLFVLLVFAYYAAYDVVLPGGNGALPALAPALLGLAAVLAMRGPRERRGAGLGPTTGVCDRPRRPSWSEPGWRCCWRRC